MMFISGFGDICFFGNPLDDEKGPYDEQSTVKGGTKKTRRALRSVDKENSENGGELRARRGAESRRALQLVQ